jgi:hypothetical protein
MAGIYDGEQGVDLIPDTPSHTGSNLPYITPEL